MKPFIKVNQLLFTVTAILYIGFVFFLVVFNQVKSEPLTKPTMLIILVLTFFTFFATTFAVVNRRYYRAYKIIKGIADFTHDGIIITNEDNKIIYANETAIIESGYSKEELIGETPSLFKSGKHSQSFYQTMWDNLRDDGLFKGEIWDLKKDGTLHPKKLSIFTVKNAQNKVLNYVAVYQDLSAIKESQAQSKQHKYYNAYTDLPNQVYTLNRMRSIIQDSKPFTLVLIKVINQSMIASNHGLMYYYDSVKYHTKEVQEMFKPELIGEIESDSFAVLLESKPASIKETIEAIIQKFEGAFNDASHFECRAGVVNYPKDGTSATILLTKATIALEMSMDITNPPLTYFDNRYHQKLTEEYQIKDHILQGIEDNEFYLVYQPILEIKSNRIKGVEALVRWNSKTLGHLSPQTFIPVAEKYQLMRKLGKLILFKTIQDKAYFDQTLKEPLKVSMNTSADQYGNADLLEDLKAFLNRFNVEASSVVFEITESTLIKDMEETKRYLKRLTDLGITFAIDDYGTGFSSLQYLHQLPVDILKIDRSFISGIPKKDEGILASSIIHLAKELKLKSVAEGVETKEQFNYLSEKKVDYMQGYFISKPLTRDQLIEFMINHEKNRHKSV